MLIKISVAAQEGRDLNGLIGEGEFTLILPVTGFSEVEGTPRWHFDMTGTEEPPFGAATLDIDCAAPRLLTSYFDSQRGDYLDITLECSEVKEVYGFPGLSQKTQDVPSPS